MLALNENKLLPKNSDKIDEFIKLKPQLKKHQYSNILWQWEAAQKTALQNAKNEKRNPISLYNKRGSKGERRNSLRKIIETDFNLFTSFFPVVLTNPSVCSSILPLKEGLFDLVIFDEASQLRVEDTYTSLLRGKAKIVSGDSQQMPPSSYFMSGANLTITNEDEEDETIQQAVASKTKDEAINLAESESLLDYAVQKGYHQSMLRVHYRSLHPDLIQFSNHAFYGNKLIPILNSKEYKPIEFVEVNGFYQEQQNTDEAEKVIDILLNQIQPLSDGTYPSVGIATLNLKQRNLILTKLKDFSQLSDDENQKNKLENFYTAGLFVKNLENIQGDERDIIILSTTFGKRPDGTFRQNFGPLGQSQGHKLLNVIVTRAKYKVYVCCSIPESHISAYSELIQEGGSKGRGLFYAYLAYAKAISDENRDSVNSILEHILKHSTENNSSQFYDVGLGSESPFEEEVYNALAQRIGKHRISQQYPVGNFRIDMVVEPLSRNKRKIAIECDGAKYHSSNEAYAWDIFRQQQIEKQGFDFHRIWSTNWWNNHQKETESVVEFIKKHG